MNKKYYLIILTLILVSANCSYSISLKDRAIKIFNKALPSNWVCKVEDLSLLKDDYLLQITGNTPAVLCTLEYSNKCYSMAKSKYYTSPKYYFSFTVFKKWDEAHWEKYKKEVSQWDPAIATKPPTLSAFAETKRYTIFGDCNCPDSIKTLLIDLLNKL